MYLCYLDESGVPEISGSTSHFVLLGLSIDSATWKAKDLQIVSIKKKYGLEDVEIHSAYMARPYLEQEKLPCVAGLDPTARLKETQRARDSELIAKAALRGASSVMELRKNFRKTADYIHLTHAERLACLGELIGLIAGWPDCVLFAECMDKRAFGGKKPITPLKRNSLAPIHSADHRDSAFCRKSLYEHDSNGRPVCLCDSPLLRKVGNSAL